MKRYALLGFLAFLGWSSHGWFIKKLERNSYFSVHISLTLVCEVGLLRLWWFIRRKRETGTNRVVTVTRVTRRSGSITPHKSGAPATSRITTYYNYDKRILLISASQFSPTSCVRKLTFKKSHAVKAVAWPGISLSSFQARVAWSSISRRIGALLPSFMVSDLCLDVGELGRDDVEAGGNL